MINKKIRLLVVGGTGFIGYHLSKKAISKGWSVTSISTSRPDNKRFLAKVNYKICDITKKKKLISLLKDDFTYVVNLAGYVDHTNKNKVIKSHFIGCKNLADIFKKKKIKSFIQMGSSVEYGKANSPQTENMLCKPVSVYGSSKYFSTKYLLELYNKYEFPVTIFRLYQSYGKKQDLNRLIPIVINSCIKNEKFACSNGKQSRDFIYIDDAIKALFYAMKDDKAKGQIFNLGSGKPTQVKNLILTIKKLIGKGTPQFGKITLRPEESIKIYANTKKIKKILRWQPSTSLKTGLRQVINYYKNGGCDKN